MEWIHVEQDLPDRGKPVWIYWRDKEVVLGHRTYEKNDPYPKNEGWYSYYHEKCRWAYYWMPIEKPKAPVRNLECEFGSTMPVSFASAEMLDSAGNTVKCKCGKPAYSELIGKEAMAVYCSDCNPYKTLIYRSPLE